MLKYRLTRFFNMLNYFLVGICINFYYRVRPVNGKFGKIIVCMVF